MRVVKSARLCRLFPNVHETFIHFHPSLAAVPLAQAGQKKGDQGQAPCEGQRDGCLPAAAAGPAGAVLPVCPLKKCPATGPPASSCSASACGCRRKLGELEGLGQDREAGSGRKGWGLHGGSSWEVGKSIGDQAGDRTAHPEGCPAALPLQGLKQFEATAEWADLLVPGGQRAAVGWLRHLSPPWVLPSHRLLPRLACPGCF